MKRYVFIFAVMVLALALRVYLYVPEARPDPAPVPQTRSQAAPPNPQWDATLERLRQEDTRTMPVQMMAFLQAPSGIAVNTDIPLWGVFLVIIAAVAAFVAVRQQMASHEKSDDQRFSEVNGMLKEIRDDLKHLVGRLANGD